MMDILKELLKTRFFQILLGVSLIGIVFLIVYAVLQGREVKVGPVSVGPKPSPTELSSSPTPTPYLKIYSEGIKEANKVIASDSKYQTLEELKQYHDRLEEAISQLETIPPDAKKIYAEAQAALPPYRKKLDTIKESLAQETQAQQLFLEATEIAHKANQQVNKAQSIPELKQAKVKWEQAREILNHVSSGSLIYREAQAKIQEYNHEISILPQKCRDIVIFNNTECQI